jgi:hypothetical protein
LSFFMAGTKYLRKQRIGGFILAHGFRGSVLSHFGSVLGSCVVEAEHRGGAK